MEKISSSLLKEFLNVCDYGEAYQVPIILITNAGEPEPGIFGSLEPTPLEKKKLWAGAAWGKIKEPEPLEKKIEPVPIKNLSIPQHCL